MQPVVLSTGARVQALLVAVANSFELLSKGYPTKNFLGMLVGMRQ